MPESSPKHARLAMILAVLFVSAIGVAFVGMSKRGNDDLDPLVKISLPGDKKSPVDSCVADLREYLKAAEDQDIDLSQHFPMSPNAVLSYVDDAGNVQTMDVKELARTHDLRKMNNLQDAIQEGHKMMAVKNKLYFLFGSNLVIAGDVSPCQITGVYGPRADGSYHPHVALEINANIQVAKDSKKFVHPIGEPCITPYFSLYIAGTVYQSKPQDYIKQYLKSSGLRVIGDKRSGHWRMLAIRQDKTKRIFFVFRGVSSVWSALHAFFGTTHGAKRNFNRYISWTLRRNRKYRAYACIGHSRGGWFANKVSLPYKVWRITFNGHKCNSGDYNVNLRCKGDVVSANSNQYITLRCSGHGLTAFKNKLRYKYWSAWHRRVNKQIRKSRRCVNPPTPPRNIGLSPFYRYWNKRRGDHFYTTNPKVIGTTRRGRTGRWGYKSEGIACYIAKQSYGKLVPLYQYWQSGRRDHFYTTNPKEIGTTRPGRVGKYGYKSQGIAGYCSKKKISGSVPLYRYWNGRIKDHFYTTNFKELLFGRHGYRFQGVQCFVWRQRKGRLLADVQMSETENEADVTADEEDVGNEGDEADGAGETEELEEETGDEDDLE